MAKQIPYPSTVHLALLGICGMYAYAYSRSRAAQTDLRLSGPTCMSYPATAAEDPPRSLDRVV